MDELHLEAPGLHPVAILSHMNFRLLQILVLLQLEPHQPGGEPCAVDGHIQLPQHIGQRADMVLMGVGQEDGLHLIPVFLEIGDVRDDHIHAQQVLVREGHARVDDDDILPIFQDGHVLADLIEAAQGDHPQPGLVKGLLPGLLPAGAPGVFLPLERLLRHLLRALRRVLLRSAPGAAPLLARRAPGRRLGRLVLLGGPAACRLFFAGRGLSRCRTLLRLGDGGLGLSAEGHAAALFCSLIFFFVFCHSDCNDSPFSGAYKTKPPAQIGIPAVVCSGCSVVLSDPGHRVV